MNSTTTYSRSMFGLTEINADVVNTGTLNATIIQAPTFKTNLVQSINSGNDLTLESLGASEVYIKSNGTNIAVFDRANNLITFNARVSQVRSDNAVSFGPNACLAPTGTTQGLSAFGAGALQRVTGGNFNSAFGNGALNNVLGGSNNVAIGNDSGRNITSGAANMCIGLQALFNSSTASDNIGVGTQSGSGFTTGGANVCIGTRAGIITTTFGGSSNNVSIGTEAGQGLGAFGGNNNTVIGHRANFTANTASFSNSTCIGVNSVITASNQITLGRTSEFVCCPNNLVVGKTTNTTAPNKLEVEGQGEINGNLRIRNSNNLQIFNNGNTRQTNCYMFNDDLYINNTSAIGGIAFQINTSSIASISSTAINSNVYITVPNEPALSNNNRCANTAYVDTAITTALTGLPTLSGSNTWTGTNLFANNIPTISTLLTPTTSQQLINLGFADGRYAQLASSNTFTGLTNTFNSSVAFGTQAPTCSFAPTLNSSLANKEYVDTAYQKGQEATSVIYLYDDFLSNNSELPSSISGGWIFNGTGSATYSFGTVKEHPGMWTLGNNRAIGFLSNIPTYLPNTLEWVARITSASNVFTLYAGIAQGYSNFTNSAFFGHTSGTTTLYASINNVNLYNFTTVTWIQNKWYSYKIIFNDPDVTFTIKNITDNLTETYTATASSYNFATNLFPQYQQIGTMTSEVDYFALSYQSART